jgi:Protein of unknown function (DUF2690)
MRKALAAIGATAMLTVSGLAMGASSAKADNLPFDGQDPVATGCSNSAVTVASRPIVGGDGRTIGRVDLRWSNACLTNWARTVSFGSIESDGDPEAQVVRDTDGKRFASNFGAPGSTVWTAMVYGNHICVHAEGQIDLAGFATTPDVC